MVFNCQQCDYTSTTKGHLQRHIKSVHLKLKPFNCDICDKSFAQNGDLQRHIKSVHLKQKPFKCNQCDYTFSTNFTLQRHIKSVHLKMKPHNCNQCDYTCSQNSMLQRHIKSVHLKLKPHKCQQCDKSFSTNVKLQQHIKSVHLKLKPFKCNHCDRPFALNNDLQRHIKRCISPKLKGSKGERAVMAVLDSMSVEYAYDMPFIVKDIKMLRWDFRIDTETEPIFIEFDGKQHSVSVKHFGGEYKLKETQRRDEIKNEFCRQNDYPLLRIPYTEFDNIKTLVSEFIIYNTHLF